jgi:hypothetical protein
MIYPIVVNQSDFTHTNPTIRPVINRIRSSSCLFSSSSQILLETDDGSHQQINQNYIILLIKWRDNKNSGVPPECEEIISHAQESVNRILHIKQVTFLTGNFPWC